MVMLIVGAMVETLVKHMTQKYLDNMDGVKVGGAPSWYMEPVKNQMCVFTHQKGSFGAIDVAKEKARFKMKKKIDDVIEVVIYDTKGDIKDKKEKEVVKRFSKDENLDAYIKSKLKYTQVTYADEVKTAFVRACIPKKDIIEYQKGRLMVINEAVLSAKSSSAFDSLDDEFGDEKSNKDDKFDF